jgi:thiol-activated cytolysin
MVLPLAACAASVKVDNSNKAIDQYISSLPYLPVTPTGVEQGQTGDPQRDGDYQCTTQDMSETRQYDRVVAYAANSDSLFPGALVSADSVLTGLFTEIALPRGPATISVSLENLAGGKTATIVNPSLGAYRDALAGILDSEITGSTAANLYSEIEQVHSEEQLDMALGVEASWGFGLASLKSSFDFSNKTVRSRYVVRYTQAYYTVDVDAPGHPSDVFARDVTLSDVQAAMDQNRPPAYVSSVTYGRMVLFTFESEYSGEEMRSALNFAYTGGLDLTGDVSVTYKDMITSSKITAYIIGGDAGAAVKAIDSYDSLIAFIKEGGNYSKDSPGAPIAYKISYLKDNSPARLSLTTDYQVNNCIRVSQKVKVTLNAIAVDQGGDLQIYGDILATGSDTQSLFHKGGNEWVDLSDGHQLGPPISETVIDVSPQPGQTIQVNAHLFDSNSFFSDDDLGNDTAVHPFEAGWRKDGVIYLTGAGDRVRVEYSLTPI